MQDSLEKLLIELLKSDSLLDVSGAQENKRKESMKSKLLMIDGVKILRRAESIFLPK
jgi:hypothetical protein